MTYIVAIDRQNGTEAGYLAINEGAGFTRNEHMERAYRTTKDDAEELAADYNDYYQMKGYNLRAKAVRYVETKQVETVEPDGLNAQQKEEDQPEPEATGYQIFDSMDVAQSGVEQREELLFPLLDTLAEEAAEEGRPVTFAIAKVFEDGGRTYDF